MPLKNPFFRLLTLFLFTSLVFSCAETETPPNVIFILADDLGYGDLGSYGQQEIRTPHLDRLATNGMRFTNHYAGSTVCAPSRSVLLLSAISLSGSILSVTPSPLHVLQAPTGVLKENSEATISG